MYRLTVYASLRGLTADPGRSTAVCTEGRHVDLHKVHCTVHGMRKAVQRYLPSNTIALDPLDLARLHPAARR